MKHTHTHHHPFQEDFSREKRLLMADENPPSAPAPRPSSSGGGAESMLSKLVLGENKDSIVRPLIFGGAGITAWTGLKVGQLLGKTIPPLAKGVASGAKWTAVNTPGAAGWTITKAGKFAWKGTVDTWGRPLGSYAFDVGKTGLNTGWNVAAIPWRVSKAVGNTLKGAATLNPKQGFADASKNLKSVFDPILQNAGTLASSTIDTAARIGYEGTSNWTDLVGSQTGTDALKTTFAGMRGSTEGFMSSVFSPKGVQSSSGDYWQNKEKQ